MDKSLIKTLYSYFNDSTLSLQTKSLLVLRAWKCYECKFV